MRPDIPVLGFPAHFNRVFGYDPFTETGLKATKSNETSSVAFFSSDAPLPMGQKIMQHRLKMRESRKQFALELGVSIKTLWGWETDRWQPSTLLKVRIGNGLTLDIGIICHRRCLELLNETRGFKSRNSSCEKALYLENCSRSRRIL